MFNNLWNILVFSGVFIGWLLVDYGVYGIIYTRKIHVNAWIVRGLFLVIPAVIFYFSYKYDGKVYLTAQLPALSGGMAVFSLLYLASCPLSDRYKHLEAIKKEPNNPTRRIYANKIYNRHYNTWRDPIKLWKWLTAEVLGIFDMLRGNKNTDIKLKNDDIVMPERLGRGNIRPVVTQPVTKRTGTLVRPGPVVSERPKDTVRGNTFADGAARPSGRLINDVKTGQSVLNNQGTLQTGNGKGVTLNRVNRASGMLRNAPISDTTVNTLSGDNGDNLVKGNVSTEPVYEEHINTGQQSQRVVNKPRIIRGGRR